MVPGAASFQETFSGGTPSRHRGNVRATVTTWSQDLHFRRPVPVPHAVSVRRVWRPVHTS